MMKIRVNAPPPPSADCFTVVKNVFSHRETESSHRGINDAVNDAVEFVFLPEEEDEENDCLADFFNNRSGDNSAKCFCRARISCQRDE